MFRFRRVAALGMVAALMVSIGAQCLVAHEQMTTEPMLCCAGIHHDCGAAIGQDCCESERAAHDQLLNQIQRIHPPVALLTGATAVLFRPPDAHHRFDIETTPLKASPPPRYVLLATFLI